VRAIQNARFCATAVSATKSDVSTGIFPAGKKQAKVQLPALFVVVNSQEALLPDLPQLVEKCVSAGASALVVRDSSTGGADLFKATAQLKDVVRGRVAVLLEDRTDIVAATEIDGVVLTSQGAGSSSGH
jgi:thiamine monophosphate synthase